MTKSAPVPLKYLFRATFADGSVIVQTPDDKSIIDPEKRSQFYDVIEMAKRKQLVAFVLEGEGHEYGVDLRDGHFEIDGVAFAMHEQPYVGFELIFFRQHTHDFEQGVQQDAQPKEVKHEIVYRFGWKLKGDQQTQRVMQFD